MVNCYCRKNKKFRHDTLSSKEDPRNPPRIFSITILDLYSRSPSTSTIICSSLSNSLMIDVQQHLGSIPTCCLPRSRYDLGLICDDPASVL